MFRGGAAGGGKTAMAERYIQKHIRFARAYSMSPQRIEEEILKIRKGFGQ
jgi:hypothetical protein